MHGKIYDNITQLVGNTPLVRLNRIVPDGAAEVAVKIEAFNPLSSVKDRIALSMVEEAERAGELRPGSTIVEATSGNTGVGLAFVAALAHDRPSGACVHEERDCRHHEHGSGVDGARLVQPFPCFAEDEKRECNEQPRIDERGEDARPTVPE